MSLVFNMVGGGSGGGLTDGSALLSVTVHTGSTVTATKSGVTLQPSLWLSGADASTEVALFAFLPSQLDSTTPWTITATIGTTTISGTVYITSNKEYEVSLATKYLYNAGDQCTDVTGGWRSYPTPIANGYTADSATFNANDIYLYCRGALISCATDTIGQIDVTSYTKLHVEYTGANIGANYVRWGLRSSNTGYYDKAFVVYSTDVNSRVIDISSVSGSYYVFFGLHKGESGASSATITKIWLEP